MVKTYSKIPIQGAQTLNLRNIVPIMSETEEKFTLRPREIQVNIWNVEQLNRHPELFEKVENVNITTEEFNYDCLPVGIKEIYFNYFRIEGEKLESLEKNNWKFEESVVDIARIDGRYARTILDSLSKVRKIIGKYGSEDLIEEYSQFRFVA